jgi:N-acetylneuraminic acid mutarotase
MYDPAQEIWIERSPMPKARAYAGAAEAGGKIYVIGGYDGEEGLAVNEVYTPVFEGGNETPWSEAAPIPEGRYGMGMASLADIVYVIGGNSNQNSNFRFGFFLVESQWKSFEFSTQECYLRVVSLETNLHTLGGLMVSDASGKHTKFEAVYTTLFPIVR